MDNRISSGDNPASRCCSSLSGAWLVLAGWSARLLASPIFARCEKRPRFSMNRWPAGCLPEFRKRPCPPNPLRNIRQATAWAGSSGSPCRLVMADTASRSATSGVGLPMASTYKARPPVDGGFHLVKILRLHEACGDPELGQDVVERGLNPCPWEYRQGDMASPDTRNSSTSWNRTNGHGHAS